MRRDPISLCGKQARGGAFGHASAIQLAALPARSQNDDAESDQRRPKVDESVPNAAPTSTPAVPGAPKTKRRKHPVPESRPLPQFRVMLHHDDRQDMDRVVRAIVELTPLPRARAYVVMLMAHTRGLALILITHRERAELYQQQFRCKGLTVTIEAAD